MGERDEWELENNSELPEACGLGLKKYFYFIGAGALVILMGTYWYTNYYHHQSMGGEAFLNGLGLGGGATAAVNSPAAVNARPSTPRSGPAAAAQRPLPQRSFTPSKPMVQNIGGNDSFATIAMNLRNSIVNISTTGGGGMKPTGTQNGTTPDAGTVAFANPFSPRSRGSIGSGVIVRDDGYIVSNYHIVRGASSAVVTVFTNQGTQRYKADIVKMDEAMDLVLMKIAPPTPLKAAPFADSSQIRVADEVIAIGSPFGLDQTVSRGIVSALRKSLAIEGITHSDLIQTDAAINQGNSGGPLIGNNGTVIGINTAIYTPTGAFAGIGFAIPSNQVRAFMRDEMGTPLQAPRSFNAAAPNTAAPVIRANAATPGNHRADGRANMACSSCHQISGQPTNRAVAFQPIAAPANMAGPTIRANARTPGNHKGDGRASMACSSCHQITGQPTNRAVAFQSIAAPANMAGPTIRANARTPGNHKGDGRASMACSSCHQITGQPTNRAVAFQPIAAPMAGPTISGNANAPGNHRADGRAKMACTTCHQIAGQAGGQPAAMQFANPPTSLALNVAVANGNAAAFGVPGANLTVLGAGLMPISAALAERLNHPQDRGVFVSQVISGSPAADAGLHAGDIILKVGGRRVWAPGQLGVIVNDMVTGDTLRIGVLRDGQRSSMEVTVVEMPMAAPANQRSAVATPRAVPNEFNWRGVNIENFITVAPPTTPGDPGLRGAEIDGVTKGSAAAKAGLQKRDVILKINSQPVGMPGLLDKAIQNAKGQTSNLLMVMRNGRQFFVVLP